MTDHPKGPPGSEKPAPQPQDRPSRNNLDATDTTTRPATEPGKTLVWIPCTRPPAAQDIRSQLARRHAARQRVVPLDCGCRDPWPCRCTEPPLSEQAVDGYRAAATHILSQGQTPLVPIEALRALYRRGGDDRELAEQLHAACGGEVG